MVFTERVRIGIPSREEIQELESNVMELERLATRSATANLSVQESFGESGPVLPSALTRRRRNAALGRGDESGLLAKQRIKGASTTSASSVAGLHTNAFKEMQREVTDLKNFNSQLSQSAGFLLNPVGNIQGRALGLAAGIPGVGFAASIAPMVYQMIVAQHGAGGIFDVTKQTLDNTKSFIGLEREAGIDAGETLFLGNVALRQGIPHNITSNTQDLQDGQRRYTLQTIQFGR